MHGRRCSVDQLRVWSVCVCVCFCFCSCFSWYFLCFSCLLSYCVYCLLLGKKRGGYGSLCALLCVWCALTPWAWACTSGRRMLRQRRAHTEAGSESAAKGLPSSLWPWTGGTDCGVVSVVAALGMCALCPKLERGSAGGRKLGGGVVIRCLMAHGADPRVLDLYLLVCDVVVGPVRNLRQHRRRAAPSAFFGGRHRACGVCCVVFGVGDGVVCAICYLPPGGECGVCITTGLPAIHNNA